MKIKILLSCLLLLALTACGGATVSAPTQPAVATSPATVTAAPTAVPTPAVFSDPFAYCATVGQIDAPDAHYTGPKMDEALFKDYLAAAKLDVNGDYPDAFKQMTVWRCMANKVYACNFGANIPCDSKANTDKTPTQEMKDFCSQNQSADFIPMAVTGHNVIYSWHCVSGAPEILQQIDTVDAAGYQASFWVALEPVSPGAQPTPAGFAGQIVFYSNRDGGVNHIYLMDGRTQSSLIQLTRGNDSAFSGPFSPDSTRILFTGFGPTHSYVGVMNADGSNPVDLSNQSNSDEGFPAWSPDGSQVAFTSRRAGNNEIYVMNADGSAPKRLTNNPKDDFAPSWSPDGKQIAFVSDRDNATGIYSIYIMSSDGSSVKRLTDDKGNDYTPAWSSDGSRIAFRSVQNSQSDIYLVNVDGSSLADITHNPSEDWSPSWSPDGSLIAFQTNRNGNWEIYTINADGSNPVNLTNNPADDQLPFWAPAAQPAGIGMANPASVNCTEKGGTLKIEQRGDLGQIGVCYFEDNRQCEEWALMNGACPVGGLKVTGYVTDAARFCAISGGQYAITGNSGAVDEQGTCTFSTGKTCNAQDYYNGTCGPNQ
jgi:Tol biopolymer transport system component